MQFGDPGRTRLRKVVTMRRISFYWATCSMSRGVAINCEARGARRASPGRGFALRSTTPPFPHRAVALARSKHRVARYAQRSSSSKRLAETKRGGATDKPSAWNCSAAAPMKCLLELISDVEPASGTLSQRRSRPRPAARISVPRPTAGALMGGIGACRCRRPRHNRNADSEPIDRHGGENRIRCCARWADYTARLCKRRQHGRRRSATHEQPCQQRSARHKSAAGSPRRVRCQTRPTPTSPGMGGKVPLRASTKERRPRQQQRRQQPAGRWPARAARSRSQSLRGCRGRTSALSERAHPTGDRPDTTGNRNPPCGRSHVFERADPPSEVKQRRTPAAARSGRDLPD